MTTENKRIKFDTNFKKEAVARVTQQGYSIKEAANMVDVSEKNLRRWNKDFEQVAICEKLDTDDRAELEKFRKENKELRMEKEILKKASAFFAKK
ncbi:MAG: transposase [Pseudomonadales bacterium]|nr:transposase [Pseudomonadales bacterium]